jgi:CheY-like chemotaxis protein
MGGQVEARSRLGEGSEFIVRLPAAPPGAAVALPAAAPGPAAAGDGRPVAGGARVLYIEDNPVNALLVREMLAHRPAVTLAVAEDGQGGVRQALALRPDLILLDMQLPDIDGHAVRRALLADPRTAAIRCVALSANATPGDVEAALAAGFADYWTKPIDFRRFLEGIDGLLGEPG